VPSLIESAISINNEMPSYVGKRAIDLIHKISKCPRVLVLGVAYKSGVADVRETPVSKLREYLLNNGATVKWHDQLVQVWNGEISSNLEEECDIVIVATRQPGVEITSFIEKGIPVLDCTNAFTNLEGVTSL
jgi:UDP-N-acetyl-D-glucosamine dehydrogenase